MPVATPISGGENGQPQNGGIKDGENGAVVPQQQQNKNSHKKHKVRPMEFCLQIFFKTKKIFREIILWGQSILKEIDLVKIECKTQKISE